MTIDKELVKMKTREQRQLAYSKHLLTSIIDPLVGLYFTSCWPSTSQEFLLSTFTVPKSSNVLRNKEALAV